MSGVALTRSEREIYELAVKGLSNRTIAEMRFVEIKTIKFHMTGIFKKLQVKSRAELIAKHYQAQVTLQSVLDGR